MTGPNDDEEGDSLANAIVTNIARDRETAELLRRAIDLTARLRMRLDEKNEELRLLRDLVDRQQKLLFQKGIIP
jgi:hypothetical protein